MKKTGPAIACILSILFLVGVTDAGAQSFYFLDSIYRGLQQLDDALATGDIGQDEYDQLLERILQGKTSGYESLDELLDENVVSDNSLPEKLLPVTFRLRSTFTQELERDYSSIRYDRLELAIHDVSLSLSFEHRDAGEILVRSRSLEYRWGSGRVLLGSYDLKVGQGLTLGYSSYHGALSERTDFARSLTLPVKNRHNGMLFEQSYRQVVVTAFGSLLKGEESRRRDGGVTVQAGTSSGRVGLVLLRQALDGDDGAEDGETYLAPYFSIRSGAYRLSGESSIGINAASAHIYSAAWSDKIVNAKLTMFSYGSGYGNLSSGGYAYSDYETVDYAGTGFEYRDKRRGRIGLSVSSSLKVDSARRLRVDLVRWRNRVAGRECASAKLSIESSGELSSGSRIRATAIWQNLDITHDDDIKAGLSLSTRLPLSRRFTLSTYQRVETRQQQGDRRRPGRLSLEGSVNVGSMLSLILGLDYYDPDMLSSGNSRLYLTMTQQIRRAGSLLLRTSGRVRYEAGTGGYDGWELRILLETTR